MSLTAPRFHPLRIRDITQETRDAVSVAFDVPPALASAYRFRAGQYLTLRTRIDGEEVRRSYSICSGEDDGELRIAIKRLEGGLFSTWAQDALRPGSEAEVMTPTGRFAASAEPGGLHVGFAAGSGITPILSLLKTVLARNDHTRFVLFYGSRSTSEILFRGALEDLKDRWLGRLSVFHVLSQERQDVDVLNGRLDRDKLDLLLGRVLGGTPITAAYVCGPFGMIDTVEALLRERDVPPARIHVERFTSALDGKPRPRAAPAPSTTPHAMATIVLDGLRTEIGVAEGESVLDAAIRAGLDLPFSCKGGMCSTCRAKLISGTVEMAVNYALDRWETEAGFVLTCQARPTSAQVAVDYDHQ